MLIIFEVFNLFLASISYNKQIVTNRYRKLIKRHDDEASKGYFIKGVE